MSNLIPLPVIAVVDCLFMLIATFLVSVPIFKKGNSKNFLVIGALLLLLGSNITFYAGEFYSRYNWIYIGLYSGVYSVLMLIFILTNRVIPFFTAKGVGYAVTLKDWAALDYINLILFSLFWIFSLVEDAPIIVTVLSISLFFTHTIRLYGWYSNGIWKKPLLWVLYVGYAFIIMGFALKVISYFYGFFTYIALHSFTVGGIGLITIGMIARVSLGHTGRDVHNDLQRPYNIIFLMMLSGACIRIFMPLFNFSLYSLWIGLSQMLWMVSFTLLLYFVFPILIKANKLKNL